MHTRRGSRRARAALLSVVLTMLVGVAPAAAETGAGGGRGWVDGGGERTAGGVRAAIVDGEHADGNPQVVRIIVDWSDGALSLCTGAFVTTEWVLTAAHCLVSPGRAPVTVSLESGSDRLVPGTPGYWSALATTWATHPGYASDDGVAARNDVALLRSSTSSPYAVAGVPYLAADLEPGWGEPDAVGILFGAGLVGPSTLPDHLRYAGFDTKPPADCATIASSAGATFDAREAFCGEGIDPDGFADPEACNGDSGGPFFTLSTDGRLGLAGVLSGSVHTTPCADSIAFFTRTGRHVDWITSVTGRGPMRPTEPAPRPPATPSAPDGSGYWLLQRDGDVSAYGGAPTLGGVAPAPGTTAVAIAARPQGDGYWVLTSSGDILASGAAVDFGAVDGTVLTKPGEVVSTMSPAPDGAGLWVFTTAGRILDFGTATPSARMQGADALVGLTLEGPIVDSVATPSGLGAYLVAMDGGVFAVGDATFRGSVRGQLTEVHGPPGLPAQPVVGVVADPDGDGYWMVAADGGVFGFEAPFRGSLPALVPFDQLASPVNGMVPFGDGYLLVAADGGVFNFSDRAFSGSGAGLLDSPVVGVAAVGS